MCKGSRREAIRREHILDTLGSIQEEYRKHASAVLVRVQQRLSDTMGYTIVSSEHIIGYRSQEGDTKSSLPQEYFLTSCLRDPVLQHILSRASDSLAYTSFVFVVCMAIYTSPLKKAATRDILMKVRKVDRRFPESLAASTKTTKSIAVPELENDFLGLIQRMKKVIYIFSDCLQGKMMHY